MNYFFNRIGLYFLSAMLLCACQSKFVALEDLSAYVMDEDHGLVKSRTFNGFSSKLSYRPRDFFIAQELEGEDVNQLAVDKLLKKYKDYHYFVWELSYDGKEALYAAGAERFSENVQNLAFRMGEYASLTTSQSDTIPLADAIFPRTYGMGSSTSVLMVFSGEATVDDEWLSVNIAEMGFGLGDQLFRFKNKDLNAIPRLDVLKDYLKGESD